MRPRTSSLPVLAVLTALAGSPPASLAVQDAASQGGATAKPLPAWSIPWLGGESFSNKSVVIKRFGRLQRNDIWDNKEGGDIRYLATACLALDYAAEPWKNHESIVRDLKELHAYAKFYLARVRGRQVLFNPPRSETEKEAAIDEMLALLKSAVELGYTNPDEIEAADELDPLRLEPEFQELVNSLREEAQARIRRTYQRAVEERFERFARGEPGTWKPALQAAGGADFWPADGKPVALVLCRIHHAGFEKLLPRLRALKEATGGAVHVVVAFYQLFDDDSARTRQTQEYARALGLDLPYAVIGRDHYLELRELLRRRFETGAPAAAGGGVEPASQPAKGKPRNATPREESFEIFQPVTVFLDASGTPLYQANGVLFGWQLALVAEKVLAAGGTGEPKPQEEPPPSTSEPRGEEPAEAPAEPERPGQD